MAPASRVENKQRVREELQRLALEELRRAPSPKDERN